MKTPTLKDLLQNATSYRGADMGRQDVGVRPTNAKLIYCRKLIIKDGYDKGGAYWGSPNNLYVEYTKDLSYIYFFRFGGIKSPSEFFREYYMPTLRKHNENGSHKVANILHSHKSFNYYKFLNC